MVIFTGSLLCWISVLFLWLPLLAINWNVYIYRQSIVLDLGPFPLASFACYQLECLYLPAVYCAGSRSFSFGFLCLLSTGMFIFTGSLLCWISVLFLWLPLLAINWNVYIYRQSIVLDLGPFPLASFACYQLECDPTSRDCVMYNNDHAI